MPVRLWMPPDPAKSDGNVSGMYGSSKKGIPWTQNCRIIRCLFLIIQMI